MHNCASLTGSSGTFSHSGLTPGRHSLRIIARDPLTQERAILRGYFTVFEDLTEPDKHVCGVIIVNAGSEVQDHSVEVNFTGTGATRGFQCRVDRGRRGRCK